MYRIGLVLSPLVLLSGLLGCGASHYPVEGAVRFKNGKDPKVLAGGTVYFEPLDPKIPGNIHGALREDGSFKLGREAEGDGIEPGDYKVLVIPPATHPDRPRKGKAPLSAVYQRRDLTPLQVRVEAKQNSVQLEVE